MKKLFFQVIFASLFASLATIGIVAATTAIGANISTDGNLNVTGIATLSNASTTQLTATGSTYLATSGGNVGIGTTSPVGKVEIGDTDATALGLNGIKLTRTLNGSGINQDNIRDLSIINPSGAGAAFASFDTSITAQGDFAYNHLAAFQNRIAVAGNANVGYIRGYYDNPTFNGSGTLTDRYSLHVRDVLGTGAVTNNYGLVIDSLTRGTNNYAIYTHTGLVQFGDTTRINKTTGATSQQLLKLQFSDALGAGASIGFWDQDIVELTRIEGVFDDVNKGSLRFYTRGAAGAGGIVERMRITDSGNVGIGTTTPANTFEVHASTGTTTASFISQTANVGSKLILEDMDGAGCSEITVLDGVISARTVTCPAN